MKHALRVRGMFNVHKSHIWAPDNPQTTRERVCQVRCGWNRLGHCGEILPTDTLTVQRSPDFLENALLRLLQDVPQL